MATILKNILSFTGLVVGVPVALLHRLNVNGIPALPRTVEPDSGGFTITADATSVTVTRTVDGGAAVNVLVEFWHTIEAVVPLVPPPGQLIGQVPWIQQPGAGGGGGGSTIIVEDEGAIIPGNPKSTLDFIGAGVTATDGGGGIATITIPGGPAGPPGPAGADGAPYVLTYRPGSVDVGPLIFNDFNALYAQFDALRTAIGGPPNSGLFKILIDDQSAPTPGTVVLDSGPGDIVYDLQYTELVGALWSGGAYLADHGNVNLQIKDGGGETDSLTIINALEFTGLNITGTGQDTVFDAQDGQVFRLTRTVFSGDGGQFVLDFIDVGGVIVLNDDSQLISSGTPAVRVNNGVVEVHVNGENVYVNADAVISGAGGSLTAIINSSSAVYEVPFSITVNSLTMVSAAGLWSPDPNGVLSAEMGVLVSDAVTGFVWRNTDGVTAWSRADGIDIIDSSPEGATPVPPYSFLRGMAITPSGSRVYVGSFSGSAISQCWYFDPVNNKWAPLAVTAAGTNPISVVVSLDGLKLYALDGIAGVVRVVSTVTHFLLTTIPGFTFPSNLALTPDGSEVWVADYGANQVVRIDVATDTIVGAPIASTTPQSLTFLPDGSACYVSLATTVVGVDVIDTTTFTVVATIARASIDAYAGAAALPDSSQIYINSTNTDVVQRVDTATNLIVGAAIPVGTTPSAMAINPAGTKVFVLNRGTRSVSVITVAGNTVTNTILNVADVGDAPSDIIINAAGTRAYVSNTGEKSFVTVIDLGTETIIDVVEGTASVEITNLGTFDTLSIAGATLTDQGGGKVLIELPPMAVVFDDAQAFNRFNIRSDRGGGSQSPIDNTKIGITNFGSQFVAGAFGATDDYATVGGGARNLASGYGSTVVGGFGCTASGDHSVAGGTSEATGEAAAAFGDGCLASGEASFAHGSGTQALGDFSIAMGNGVQATAEHAVAFGNGTNATGDGAFAIGDGCNANGDYSAAIGEGCNADGDWSVALCESWAQGAGVLGQGSFTCNEARTLARYAFACNAAHAEGNHSHARGYSSKTTRETQGATAGGTFAVDGDAQTSDLVLRGSTPGVGVGESVELKFGASGTTQMILEDAKAYAFVVTAVIGGTQAGPVRRSRSIEIKFNARRDGGTTVITASGTTDAYGDVSTATWTLTPTVGVAPDRIVLTFNTGAGAASACKVAAKVEFTEVLY